MYFHKLSKAISVKCIEICLKVMLLYLNMKMKGFLGMIDSNIILKMGVFKKYKTKSLLQLVTKSKDTNNVLDYKKSTCTYFHYKEITI